jgi:hypothetical protein
MQIRLCNTFLAKCQKGGKYDCCADINMYYATPAKASTSGTRNWMVCYVDDYAK